MMLRFANSLPCFLQLLWAFCSKNLLSPQKSFSLFWKTTASRLNPMVHFVQDFIYYIVSRDDQNHRKKRYIELIYIHPVETCFLFTMTRDTFLLSSNCLIPWVVLLSLWVFWASWKKSKKILNFFHDFSSKDTSVRFKSINLSLKSHSLLRLWCTLPH